MLLTATTAIGQQSYKCFACFRATTMCATLCPLALQWRRGDGWHEWSATYTFIKLRNVQSETSSRHHAARQAHNTLGKVKLLVDIHTMSGTTNSMPPLSHRFADFSTHVADSHHYLLVRFQQDTADIMGDEGVGFHVESCKGPL
jgi:hypothetical protein